ncbi:MAG TPA: DUF4252 domain-containing protein [Tenuifilaceae bacterium]|nr:DUF4252 domain-containing protein [Tenuifilaceae bacterium]HPJ46872.1 DUF4252 domain-containing protein [Tenuifilaceae bacterium]HPQ34619.1 DUF4252 domain-containing protein [Tenuifilaceae bacterium]
MKKICFTALFAIVCIYATAQTSPVDKLFDKYSGKEGYTSVYISKYMFSMFASIDPDDKELQSIMNGLSSIKIIATDSPQVGVNFYKEVINELPVSEYKELMVVKEKDQDIKFMVKDSKGVITELIMLVGGIDNALISIQGDNINLKTISNISKSMQIDELENLEKINEEKE